MLAEGARAVSRPFGDSYVVESWLENDGDLATQEEAASRPSIRRAEAEVRDLSILLVRGARALAALDGCGGAAILVTDQRASGARPCLLLDADVLRATGAVAGWMGREGRWLVAAEAVAGDRPWTQAGRRGEPPVLLLLDRPLAARTRTF